MSKYLGTNGVVEAILMSSHNIPFLNIKLKISLKYAKSATVVFVPRDLRMNFETAVVNEPPVFKPLKFYCIYMMYY